MSRTLFPLDLPEREWTEFAADGFAAPVSGLVHRGTNPPACGVPVGGIDTGCLDIEASGLLGYSTIFNSLIPRRGPINAPFLGVSVDRTTWVLTTQRLAWREGFTFTWTDADHGWGPAKAPRAASEIHYWGHYPVADMEFVSDSPVGVALRAWSPFIPGDVAASTLPGAVFEVRLRNMSDKPQKGAIAMSLPGPNEVEAGTTRCTRRALAGRVSGVAVGTKRANYVLGVIGEEAVRTGGDLGSDAGAWANIEGSLPYAKTSAGASVAIDYALQPGEERVVRFVLAWHSPVWLGGGTPEAGGNAYTHMYAARWRSARAAADHLARHHERLLRRVLAWQAAIYEETTLPVWLRDALVNVLYMITETSVWAQVKPPVGDWCRPEDGVFGLSESPRGCPQIECIPCSFYGNWPLVYFFPECALSTLRTYKGYQYPDGQAPWVFGGCTVGSKPYEVALPSRGYASKPQSTLDGPCYADMVDRMWRRTGDDGLLREFYDSVKRNAIFTMNLRPGSGAAGIVSMPTDNLAQDWFESCDLFGIVPHIGGAHLAQLRMAKRMAEAVGDADFARQCAEWIAEGGAVMEEKAWAGTHYALFSEAETGKWSDIVMGYMLDGEWMARMHGLEGVFRPDRVTTTLETLRKTSCAITEHGAATFAAPLGADGQPREIDPTVWSPGYWGTRGVHPPGTFMLAMTYMYCGQREFGIELARRTVNKIAAQGWYWDWPVVIDATLPRIGFDYYQDMMLWTLPAAIAGEDLTGPAQPGGLVDRVLEAGRL